ncbi:hypothetical protein [Mycolicibacterium hippocampi]|uniref:Uncharacterized protein n=1 Tax=Mycolicibacterium hippocampi TaxID=659824 RepID=A0A850PIC5_9MYCO|nr:hypothetical protein [Mycolicibacterium hippocampi]NVN49932.1 hypothetical protein [Mycolicibacterium hippocampi]
MIVLFSVFFSVIGKLWPPPGPRDTAGEVTQFLVDENLWVRLGIAGSMLVAALALPFHAAIVLRIRRVEGQFGMLSMTQLLAAAVFTPAFIFSLIALATAAFRPSERGIEITQAFNDMFWLWFIGIVGTLVVQNTTLAIASFVDTTEPSTFPRWYGYLNIWVMMLSLPGCVVVMMNDGPLAWNGVFAFYIPGLALVTWMITTSVVISRSITAQEAAERQAVAAE